MNETPIRCYFLQESGRNTDFWTGVLSNIKDEDMEFLHFQGLEDARRAIGERVPDVVAVGLSGFDSLPFFLEARNLAPGVPTIAVMDKSDPKLPHHALVQQGAEDCLVNIERNAGSLGRRLAFLVRRQFLLGRLRQLAGQEVKPGDAAAARQRDETVSQVTKEMLRVGRLATLAEADARLAVFPLDVEAHFYRARQLRELGRAEESRQAYGRVLELSPILLGRAGDPGGFFLLALQEALKQHPGHVRGHLSLAVLLRQKGKTEAARAEYEAVLGLQPDNPEARQALDRLPPPEAGPRPRQSGPPPLTVLMLTTTLDGNGPFLKMVGDGTFLPTVLVADFCPPHQALPPHRLAVNCIGDADLCGPSLRAAQAILERSKAPVVNPPIRVLATSRAENAVRLRGIPGVITPEVVNLPKDLLVRPDGHAEIAKRGFSYPFLLRSPGYHQGRYFSLVSNEGELAPAVAALPGALLTVIRYLDGRGKDGKMRKYRVMMIDGELYPVHLALSEDWKVHYFSADMGDHPENRAEEEAFLRDMRSVLGERVFQAIGAIRDKLALDYAGVDFGLDGEGNLLFYEANACMNFAFPGPDPRWDYRRAPLSRIMEATRQMFHKRAGNSPK